MHLFSIFLKSRDLTFMRLKEAVSYFGFNPRWCFGASRSAINLRQLQQSVITNIHLIQGRETLSSLLNQTFSQRGVSHSVFELFPSDPARLLDECRVGPVSPWALDLLLKEYETRNAHAAADFCDSIAGMSHAEILRARIFERQVLKYFDSHTDPHTFFIHAPSSSAISQWIYPGSTPRVTFHSGSFTSSLETAVKDQMPLHLVPTDPNFPAIDSILYDPTASLTLIQVTRRSLHPVNVSGLQRLQRWLKRGTCLAALRPSVTGRHWRLIFVVPDTLACDFKMQDFEGDSVTSEWARKVDQYVLEICEDEIWGRTTNDKERLQ